MYQKKKQFNYYMKQVIIISTFVACFMIVNPCQLLGFQTQTTTITYDKILLTSGDIIIEKYNVPLSELKGHAYRARYYCDETLYRIEYYDAMHHYLTNDYCPPIIKFRTQNENSSIELRIFDKNEHPITDAYRDFHAIRISFDDENRIIKMMYLDKELDTLKYNPVLSIQAPVVTYNYHNKEIIVKEYDNDGRIITSYTSEKPEIPYLK